MRRRAFPANRYTALQACFPDGAGPAWLAAVGPRCAADAAPIPIPRAREGELSDLVALAWWALLQDPGDDPFTALSTKACTRHLS
ncbi:hypothetical protein OIE78_34265 (plasmid) [Streptomyces cellulosae]|uniref:hypothetical protein n=1 Tax=Streptomyces cellulosae TaxID=1968 RepID=UPI002F909852|nr:hypothetical protein OG837_35950 [Streptomyces cellulosae]